MFNLAYFFKRKILPGFYIKKHDLVIDIGSGDKPFWRADVFFDKLSLGNNQRISNSKTIHNLGLFVDGDAVSMPFKDRIFHFSFCSHLLEHVERPELVLKEIMRISKSGYIEVPNGMVESIRPFHSHLWFIYINDGQLVFIRKSKVMHNIFIKNGNNYHYLINRVKNPFIRLYWKDKINYKIINNLSNDEMFIADVVNKNDKIITNKNWYFVFIKIFRSLFYMKKEIRDNLISKY